MAYQPPYNNDTPMQDAVRYFRMERRLKELEELVAGPRFTDYELEMIAQGILGIISKQAPCEDRDSAWFHGCERAECRCINIAWDVAKYVRDWKPGN